MRNIHIVLFSLVISLTCNAYASVTLDFNELSSSSGTLTGPYLSDGYELTSSGGAFYYFLPGSPYYNTSVALHSASYELSWLAREDDQPFDLISIDLIKWQSAGGTVDILFQGFSPGDPYTPVAEQLFTAGSSWNTFDFNPNFTDLSHVYWTQWPPHHEFDNIVLNAANSIPVPGSITLTSIGVAAFLLKRKRK